MWKPAWDRIGKVRINLMESYLPNLDKLEHSYASEELFHFVGHSSPKDDTRNYETLSKVLNAGRISYPPHDNSGGAIGYKVEWDHQLHMEKLIVPNVTCYADIPLHSLSIHTEKYGKFGVALARELLIKRGARPVMYVPMRTDDWQSINGLTLLKDIEAIVKSFNEQVVQLHPKQLTSSRSLGAPITSPETAISAMESMVLKDFLAFIKPFNSELESRDFNNFYMEREWRKYGNMEFKAEQLTKIVVAKGYKERASSDFPPYRDRIIEL
jgi:hypothetical protein